MAEGRAATGGPQYPRREAGRRPGHHLALRGGAVCHDDGHTVVVDHPECQGAIPLPGGLALRTVSDGQEIQGLTVPLDGHTPAGAALHANAAI